MTSLWVLDLIKFINKNELKKHKFRQQHTWNLKRPNSEVKSKLHFLRNNLKKSESAYNELQRRSKLLTLLNHLRYSKFRPFKISGCFLFSHVMTTAVVEEQLLVGQLAVESASVKEFKLVFDTLIIIMSKHFSWLFGRP